jgi:DNA-binding transcriptional LysR family regulator
MSLSSLQLDAFFSAVRAKSFSKAARELHITQAALTQRIKSLESELGTSVFVRKPRGVEPTEAGIRLLRYCQTRDQLERETVAALTGKTAPGKLGGAVRIAGYSTVVRSVLLPALAPLLRDNPGVSLHLQCAQMRELPALLLSGEVDLAVIDHPVERADLEWVTLGEEENVLVQSKDYPTAGDVYLDHDPDDPTTAQFLRLQGVRAPVFERSYCDEIYALMDGVALGIGRGVVPRHLAERDPRLVIVSGKKPLRMPVVLHASRDAMLGEAARAAVKLLKEACPKLLEGAEAGTRQQAPGNRQPRGEKRKQETRA